MSRVKGIMALKNNSMEKNSVLYNLMSELMSFDLWILYKVKRIALFVMNVLFMILRTTYFMGIGAGIFLAYSLLNAKLELPLCNKKIAYENLKQTDIEIFGMPDQYFADKVALEREISMLKSKTSNLDTMLRKMNAELKSSHLCEKAKDVELPDFASEAAGGSVLATPDTESFYESSGVQLSFYGIPIWKPNYFTPRKIIQPWTQAGECWAFRGSQGKVELELARVTIISHVTMEHIPASLSLTGKIDSAPKEFILLGNFRNKYIKIDTFIYDIRGSPLQTFLISKQEMRRIPFKRVMLEVRSNWGNPDFTCVYRFRVHGQIFNS